MDVRMSKVSVTNAWVAYTSAGSGVSLTIVNTPHGGTRFHFPSAQFPEMSNVLVRMDTFEDWPIDKSQTAHELAEAGFYYAGVSDCTRCFYCGGGLRNWLPGDSPWTEHARWFPHCGFLIWAKGEDFIEQTEETEFDEYFPNDYEITNPSPDNDAIIQSVMNKPCSSSLTLLGYSTETIKKAVKQVLIESNWNEWQVTTARLAEIVLDMTERKHFDVTANNDVPTTDNITEIEQRNNEHTTLTLEAERRCLIEENNRLKQQKTCRVCKTKDVSVVFLPCAHLASCKECSLTLDCCVLCNVPIQGKITTFL